MILYQIQVGLYGTISRERREHLGSSKLPRKGKRLRILAGGTGCRPLGGIRFLLCFFVFVTLVPASRCASRTEQTDVKDDEIREANCKIVYLGVVGALETANNSRSGVVQIREMLNQPAHGDVCAKTFSPYSWRSGLHYVLKHFPSHSGVLTQNELDHAPKIILVGHSMGGWAVILMARNLKSKGIPVELSIQVDSVGITDKTVPSNVKTAAIFHARDILVFITTKEIRAEEPRKTRLAANVLVRHAGHESVTRDPGIREMVMNTVESLRAGSSSSIR